MEKPLSFGPNQGEFRYVFFAPAMRFDETVAFYRDGLGLPIKGGFGGPEETTQGAYVQAGSGLIEIILDREGEMKSTVLPHGQDYTAPSGGYLLIEVDNVDQAYARATRQGIPIQQHLRTWPWGHRDFKVQDPCGTVVSLFSRITQ